MGSVYYTGLSALDGFSSAINTVANNLANIQTTGFKSSDAAFSNLVAQMMEVGSSGTGAGITNPASVMQFLQGGFQATQSPLDCAIAGNGFFVTDTSGGQQLYTRDGSFSVGQNATGTPILVSSTGNAVEGYAAGANGTFSTSLSDISLPTARAATATTAIQLTGNLNSTTAPAGQATFPVTVYDAAGNQHTVSLTFTKEAGTSDWTLHTVVDGAVTGNGVPLQFNSGGQLASNPGTIPVNVAGQTVNLTLGNITQYNSPSNAAQIAQNGMPAADVTGYSIGNNGVVSAETTDGGSFAVAQLGLATIQNPQTMTGISGGDFELGANTMTPVLGSAAALGDQVLGNSLETSTTSVANEFGNLMTFQRGYEVSSKAISTEDQMRQDLFNLIQ